LECEISKGLCPAKPLWYPLLPLITRVVCNISMHYYKVRLLANMSVYKCWYVPMMQCVVNSRESGNSASDKFTMAVHVLTCKTTFCSIFYPNTVIHKWDSLRIQQIRPTVTVFLFPKLKTYRKQKIWWHVNNLALCNGATVCSFKIDFWRYFSTLTCSWRSPLWRGLTPQSCKYSISLSTVYLHNFLSCLVSLLLDNRPFIFIFP
jgi:hypothetical protein